MKQKILIPITTVIICVVSVHENFRRQCIMMLFYAGVGNQRKIINQFDNYQNNKLKISTNYINAQDCQCLMKGCQF